MMLRELSQQTVFAEIAAMVEDGSRVLDIGCGDGALLQLLITAKRVRALGIDIKEDAVLSCIGKGIPVIHGNLDEELVHCREGMYDYVILSRTLQVVTQPHRVLQEIVRIGKKAIVSFPNFGHYRIRKFLFVKGRMPKSTALPFEWYDTPNIHHLTIRDFFIFCRKHGIDILAHRYFGNREGDRTHTVVPNLFAREALFVIQKKHVAGK